MWNLKKGQNELYRTDTDSQTLKNLQFPKETVWGVGRCTEVVRWKSYKMDCDDHCTTINVINSLNKQIKNVLKISRK